MRLSVVIPTFNRRDILSECLKALFEQDFPYTEYEVLVVVDGSTDGTEELLRTLRPECGFRFFLQENRGQAAAKNEGIRQSSGELILFIDDDLLVPRDLVTRHVRAHEAGGDIVAFGAVLVAPFSRASLARLGAERFSNTTYQSEVKQNAAGRCPRVFPNSSVKRSILLDEGGFDERFFRANEDTELGLRLSGRGVEFHYLQDAVCFHVFDKGAAKVVIDEAVLDGRSEVLLCKTHSGYRRQTQIIPISRLQRIAHEIATRLPISASLLRIGLKIAEPIGAIPGLRRAAVRYMDTTRRLMLQRSAAEAAGGVMKFHDDYARCSTTLMYHHIGRPQPGSYVHLTVEPEQFEAQMRWLAEHGFTGVSARTWNEWCERAISLPSKPVVITFDDGYEDIFEYALPVLDRWGFGATIFVVADLVGGADIWNDVFPMKSAFRLGSEEQICKWAQRGFEFGSHTCSHRDLRELRSDELAEEVAGSKRKLERIIGMPVASFAYPYGEFDERVKREVSQHYAMAFTTIEGMNTLRTDPHEQLRTMVQPSETMLGFSRRVRYGRNIVTEAQRVAGQLLRDAGFRKGVRISVD